MTNRFLRILLGASAILAASCETSPAPLECGNGNCDHIGTDAGPPEGQVDAKWCEATFHSCLYDSNAHQLSNGLEPAMDPVASADTCLDEVDAMALSLFSDTCSWANGESDGAVQDCFVTGASAGEEPFTGACIENALCEEEGGESISGFCPSSTPASAGCCIGRPTPLNLWCESRFSLCLYDSGAHQLGNGFDVVPDSSEVAEACLIRVNSSAEFERGESCNWTYDLDTPQQPSPGCFMPNAFPGERPVPGQCALESQCRAREADEVTSVYSGYCPGPDEVKCCVGLDDFEEDFSWPR